MDLFESPSQRQGDQGRDSRRKVAAALNRCVQVDARDVLLGDVVVTTVPEAVVDGHDVLVVDRGRGTRLALEAFLKVTSVVQVASQLLENGGPVEGLLARKPHDAHSAAANLALDDEVAEHPPCRIRHGRAG
jgi:hypothetical protein